MEDVNWPTQDQAGALEDMSETEGADGLSGEQVEPSSKTVYTQEQYQEELRKARQSQGGEYTRRMQTEAQLQQIQREAEALKERNRLLQEEILNKVDDPEERERLLNAQRLADERRQIAADRASAEQMRSEALQLTKLGAAQELAKAHGISNWQLLLGAQTPDEMKNLAKALHAEKSGKPKTEEGKPPQKFAVGTPTTGGEDWRKKPSTQKISEGLDELFKKK